MPDQRTFHGPNEGYVLALFERYQKDPGSVEEGWRSFFSSYHPDSEAAQSGESKSASVPATELSAVVGAHEIAAAIRARGHTAARLDPLGSRPPGDPALELATHGLDEQTLKRLPADIVRGPIARRAGNAADGVRLLREIYAGTVGYEFEHVKSATEREWLRDAIESGRLREPLSTERKKKLLERLSSVEGFERYLHRTFFGQKRFSVEGTDMLVLALDEIIESAGSAGTREVIIGMAHRGRLNVLTHVLRKPYGMILSGFQGGSRSNAALAPDDFTGDVKYHMGWDHVQQVGETSVRVRLMPNPSHLEFVNPVVMGMARAAQDDTEQPGSTPSLDAVAALAVVVHGDAAFPGQGVVAETLNMSCLPGYAVGGTIHLIANNQVGFTTNPSASRSTSYASDLAKGFDIPVVHVNADDVEACLSVAKLAHAYRHRFGKDFVVDLIGYRRWGHNEGDEPAFTQPLMYETIRAHPTAREQWAEKLVAEGVLGQEEAEQALQAVHDRLDEARAELPDKEPQISETRSPGGGGHQRSEVDSAVAEDVLLEINEALLAWPEDFRPNDRLAKLLERRRDLSGEEAAIDWGHAETLAFGSLLRQGVPVRLTGQDVERGTFSHRHQVLHDAETGKSIRPLELTPGASASFEIRNSPLTEMAVVGFEYGYSVADPEVLVIWEAQFGDFANGAQVIIDQFIAAAHMKWEQTSGMVMLLPHGYEGQGPEHSSARLERFLQLAAQGNLRVVNCTTAAQYFHLLRRQALLLDREPRPLIVMSPKSLLRHKEAAARLNQLTSGRFLPLIGDERDGGRDSSVTRLVLCSGKVYVDLIASEKREAAAGVALARVEELYPFPAEELRAEIDRYPSLQELVWVQEEPKNMGAWSFIEPYLRELVNGTFDVRYEGRPFRASPAEGYADKHAVEQARIVNAAWSNAEAARTAEAAEPANRA
ncbi:2-oxoglutarate dehydrogenase E1 component [soil metagenome]